MKIQGIKSKDNKSDTLELNGNDKIVTTLCGGLLATLIELIADFKRRS